ncbi:MAG: Mu-like prophage major head subunit gpT family protein [Planctomycetia bacterium]|nr:Mu-like prophage major head subunit gpT family protein [Planctomycetia bacterium]MCC7315125.1 Mu-like prophage major head subunit gpT family protein [Planctomycetota bacterium]
MAVTINTGVTLRGLNGAFRPAFMEAVTLWKMICSYVKSTGKDESYKWLGQLPMPTEWKGKRRTQALRDFGMTLTNLHWEETLHIDRNEFADDQTGQLNLRVQEMARRFAMHPDKILIDLIMAAEAALCYDGQFFFDTDHVEGESGAQSNDLTYDAAAPTAPTEAEFEAAFWQAIEALAGFKDDQGEPWNLFQSFEDLSGILCVVPVRFIRVASRVLGANAAALLNNSTNILAGKAKLMVNPRLTWTTKFMVAKVDDPMRPFIMQDRQSVEHEIKDDKEDKEVKYMADARYNVGYGLWQKAVLTTFN